MAVLDEDVGAWRDRLLSSGSVSAEEAAELEGHLREEIGSLKAAGLAEEEAFLVAMKRLGRLNEVAEDFARAKETEFFRQYAEGPRLPAERRKKSLETWTAIALAAIAALLSRIPFFAGAPRSVFFLNAGFFAILPIGLYFHRKRETGPKQLSAFLGIGAALALASNLYPYLPEGTTFFLSALTLPLLLWLAAVFPYSGRLRPGSRAMMDFVRLTGETFIYGTLLVCGLAVLGGFTALVFRTAGLETERAVFDWLSTAGLCAAAVTACALANSKKSVVENLAPVLAKIFAPLFFLVILAFLAAIALGGGKSLSNREFLLAFDAVLAMVLGLVLYLMAARDERSSKGIFDWLALALIALGLAADMIALWAMAARIWEYGSSPNKLAGFIGNLVLFGDLAGLAWHYSRYLMAKKDFTQALRFQGRYFIVIAAYAFFVALALPPLFGWI